MEAQEGIAVNVPVEGTGTRSLRQNRSSAKVTIDQEGLDRAFFENSGGKFPPILNIKQAGELLQVSVNTIYEWSSKGYLRSCCRRRGKRLFFWRDRLVAELFGGKEWKP